MLITFAWIGGRAIVGDRDMVPGGLAEPVSAVLATEADAAALPIPRRAEAYRLRIALPDPGPPLIAAEPLNAGMPAIVDRGQPQAAETAIILTARTAPVDRAQAPQVPPVPFEAPEPTPVARLRRWSADAWALIRGSGGRGLGAGFAPATYGASQAGAVLRFRLAPSSGHRPTAYLRATRAIDGPRQTEAAVGLSARPLPDVPVVLAGEVRRVDDAFGTRLRPVALVISEFPPIDLPHGLRAEAYAQGGYAGGRGATGFIDGQVRLDGRLARIGRTEWRLGPGLWGGAQEGASRLDAGPSAIVIFPLGDAAFGRAALDWRFRVAGRAAPASGPTFTLSAGF